MLTADEENLYLLAASQPLQDIAVLMLETGMRPEEVCRLKRENVNLDEGYVLIPFGKTKAARRKRALSERAYNVLQSRVNNDKIKGAWLFPGRGSKRDDSKPLVKISNAHTAAVRRSKVAQFKLYALRHILATRATEAGMDLVTVGVAARTLAPGNGQATPIRVGNTNLKRRYKPLNRQGKMEAAIGIEPMDKGFAVHLYHLPTACGYVRIGLYVQAYIANRAG